MHLTLGKFFASTFKPSVKMSRADAQTQLNIPEGGDALGT